MERLADRLGELTRGPELRAELDLRRDERNERRAP
jgi:hypothetical protein